MPRSAKSHSAPEETAAPEAKGPLATTSAVVELVSKGIIAFAAVCFVCGIIVVNLYLRDYGVASFSLFRVSYITAGVWTFSPIAFAALIFATFLMGVLSDWLTRQDRTTKSRSRAGDLLSAAAISLIVLWALFSALQIRFSWIWLLGILVGALLGGLAAGTVFSITQGDKRSAAVLGIFWLLIFLFYLLHLAPALYRQIPASLGGGAGTRVELVIAEAKEPFVVAAGIPLAEAPVTKPVTLLIATDKTYVVAVDESKLAITLNADLVEAIRHLPPK
ncbi:MAG: hypothetical protein ABR514_01110 [Chthoniobacterales bacterium]